MRKCLDFRLLVVSFTQRDDMFRIITARLATKKEKKEYEENAIY
ncbi:MAG: BrnT family toxin [Ignavibacteriae bacterium]|nr:BrnT family toxin [Ignavibacteriota bacterium]